MADWRTISDTEVDPDAPVTSELAYAFRDNPLAMFEGAAGAPRLQTAATGPANSTVWRDWILNHNSNAVTYVVGTYLLARYTGGTSPGSVVAGSSLSATNAAGNATSGSLSGTWRAMGVAASGDGANPVTLFLRVT